ncbi:MAG: molecular chaperone GrpE [Bacteroides sp. SM23_62]|nr:MAG: molecular chaperone GrpE [Bacteroides sp. SM23_62]
MAEKENIKDPQKKANKDGEEKKVDGQKQKSAEARPKSTRTRKKPEESSKLKAFQQELQEQKEKYLRLSADFDNYRKRTMKEKIELTKQAGEEIFARILPVLDNLERAMKSVEEAQDLEAVKEGMHLIYNMFKEYLQQQGVKEIEAMHQEFNTDVHDAVTKIPAPDKKLKGKVVDVIERGYFLNDKVLRYAKVVIGE